MNAQKIKDESKIVERELSQKYPILENKTIHKELISEVSKWEESASKKLQVDNPYETNRKSLNVAKEEFSQCINSISLVKDNFKSYSNLRDISKVNIENKFWNGEIEKLEMLKEKEENPSTSKLKIINKKNKAKQFKEELPLTRKLLIQQWEKSLGEEHLKWELEELNKYRRELVKKLTEWLGLVEEMNKLLSSLSIEPGLFFDLSNRNISLQKIEELKKWLEYISKTKGVKELCDLLGRIRRAEKSIKQEKVKSISYIKETIPDINSNEEIVGIKLGKDIEHAIPEELALLSDPDTSLLFDLKYIEGRLLCFDLEGIQENILEIENEEAIEVTEEEKLGPIIICVDTSGSMSGSPETIAKAVSLYMATRAKNQDRDCYLINFSTGIETFDLVGDIGLDELLIFLQKSFHGGTDVDPALNHAVDIMKKESYEKADVLVISDFMMSSLPNELMIKINDVKKTDNKFFSLVIGDMFLSERLREVFDDEWVYNPNTCSIDNLKNVVDSVSKIY